MIIDDIDDSGRSATSRKSRSVSRSISKTPSTRTSITTKSNSSEAPKNSSGKVTEAHFKDHSTRLLAITSKAQVRYNMFYKNMHDATGPKRMEFAWDAIRDAARKSQNPKVESAFQRASIDVTMKRMLITFVSPLAYSFHCQVLVLIYSVGFIRSNKPPQCPHISYSECCQGEF